MKPGICPEADKTGFAAIKLMAKHAYLCLKGSKFFVSQAPEDPCFGQCIDCRENFFSLSGVFEWFVQLSWSHPMYTASSIEIVRRVFFSIVRDGCKSVRALLCDLVPSVCVEKARTHFLRSDAGVYKPECSRGEFISIIVWIIGHYGIVNETDLYEKTKQSSGEILSSQVYYDRVHTGNDCMDYLQWHIPPIYSWVLNAQTKGFVREMISYDNVMFVPFGLFDKSPSTTAINLFAGFIRPIMRSPSEQDIIDLSFFRNIMQRSMFGTVSFDDFEDWLYRIISKPHIRSKSFYVFAHEMSSPFMHVIFRRIIMEGIFGRYCGVKTSFTCVPPDRADMELPLLPIHVLFAAYNIKQRDQGKVLAMIEQSKRTAVTTVSYVTYPDVPIPNCHNFIISTVGWRLDKLRQLGKHGGILVRSVPPRDFPPELVERIPPIWLRYMASQYDSKDVKMDVVENDLDPEWVHHRYFSQKRTCLLCSKPGGLELMKQKKIDPSRELCPGNCMLVCDRCMQNEAPVPEWAINLSKALDAIIEYTHNAVDRMRPTVV